MAYHPEMMCEVTRISYDFDTRIGRVDMAESTCVDMSGCLGFFERIDPNVELIETFAGLKSDTIYKRGANGWDVALTR